MGYCGFQMTGMLEWGQQSKPERIPRAIKPPLKKIPGASNKTPTKSMDQKLTPKKSHAVFPSLKNFQKTLNGVTCYTLFGCTIFAELRGRDARALHKFSNCFEYPKKSLLKSSYRYPKKYLPYFPSQKNPRMDFKPKISFDHLRLLKSEVPYHPAPHPSPGNIGSLHFSPCLVCTED